MEEEDDVVNNGVNYPSDDQDKHRKIDEDQLLSIGSDDVYGVAFMI